jgi:hypothetical protein
VRDDGQRFKRRIVEQGTEGRQQHLFRAACHWRFFGADAAQIRAEVEKVNAEDCLPPEDADAVTRAIRSAMRYPAGNRLLHTPATAEETNEFLQYMLGGSK